MKVRQLCKQVSITEKKTIKRLLCYLAFGYNTMRGDIQSCLLSATKCNCGLSFDCDYIQMIKGHFHGRGKQKVTLPLGKERVSTGDGEFAQQL